MLNSGTPVAVRGLSANPAMVAAGSWRPSRSKNAARIARAAWTAVVLPASWKLRIASVSVIERGQRVAVLGLKAGQIVRQE